jgi:hypothetical protein
VRDIYTLIADIKEDIQRAETTQLPYFRIVGELLQEAECHFDDPDQWEKWLRKYLNLDLKTAWKYIRLAPKIQFITPEKRK